MNNQKNVMITGANSGIGKLTAITLAKAGFYVIIAGRSKEKTSKTIDEINSYVGENCCEWIQMHLDSLSSVKNCANIFLNSGRNLNMLINNAGLAGAHGLTTDGFELGFGVNHVGHFLLTYLLLEKLNEFDNSRVITVSSKAHKHAKFIDWELVRKKTISITGISEYAVSKLANILFTRELVKRFPSKNTSAYCLHPGIVDTDIWRTLPSFLRPLLRIKGILTPEEGAKTTIYCALNAPQKESGNYYDREQIAIPSEIAQSDALAGELWDRSLEWTKNFH
ncbi:MAG: hypothetical protein CBD16_08085 [Betaproteobacteria bacterium TMED156]|nr:MAG: hypothetical protein CBD16_08085 [Betaproteobacteria bacterium TMED156]